MTRTTHIYLDSNAIIRFIEGGDDGFLLLIEQASASLAHLCTSEFTLAEVLVGAVKSRKPELAALYEDFLVSDEALTVVPVDRDILRRSAEIRALLGNKGPDAIHVATALSASCTVFVSSDKRVRLPDGIRRVSIEEIANLDDWL